MEKKRRISLSACHLKQPVGIKKKHMCQTYVKKKKKKKRKKKSFIFILVIMITTDDRKH